MADKVRVPNKQILLIEDDTFVAELYQRALERAAYRVTIERDGENGLALAQTGRFDIILLDLMIPTINGSQILETLKRSSQPLHSKIVVFTNLEQRPSVKEHMQRLADGYIVKADVTPNKLVEFLDTLSQ